MTALTDGGGLSVALKRTAKTVVPTPKSTKDQSIVGSNNIPVAIGAVSQGVIVQGVKTAFVIAIKAVPSAVSYVVEGLAVTVTF